METIKIGLYYCKDETGNIIIDREMMVKEMDEEIAKIVEGEVIELDGTLLDGTLCRNGYPIDDCKCC